MIFNKKKFFKLIKNLVLSIFYTDYIFCFKSLFIKENESSNKILFTLNDGDFGIKINNFYFSQIIDSLKIYYFYEINFNKKFITILEPFSKKKTLFNSKKINFFHIVLKFIYKITKNDKLIVNFYKKILTNNNINKVIGIQPNEFICKASKLIGVEVYDIQHGFIQSSIRRYLKENSDSYKMPSGFIVFDKISEFILNNEIRKCKFVNFFKVILIENPYYVFFNNFENYIEKLKDTNYYFNLIDFYKKELNNINKIINKEKIKILITLQWDNSSNIFLENIIDLINKIAEKDILRNKYQFFIRLHPLDLSNLKKIDYLKNKLNNYSDFVDFKISSNVPLFLILKYVDIHITRNSAVYLDCLNYKIKTYFVDSNISSDPEFVDYLNLLQENFLEIIDFDKLLNLFYLK
ncbi:MAG: hypothetical protein N3A58_06265 [Spirochaetes bacterium]|nr:hypothetical protein [Spirochaetota bacterium]